MTTLRPQSTAAPGTSDEQDALAAPIADALWMLARQQQTGEFAATDGGSALRVDMIWSSIPLTINGTPVEHGPVEPVVEAEPEPPADRGTNVRVATELIRRLREHPLLSTHTYELGRAWAAAYPFAAAEPGARIVPFMLRLPDAAALLAALANGLSPQQLPGVQPATAAAVGEVVDGWRSWAAGRLGTSDAESPARWDPVRLAYNFDAELALHLGTVQLTARGYDGAGVEWYAFDAGPVPAGAKLTAEQSRWVYPTRVSYAGMPRPRFWELEDGHVNLDALRVDDDPSRRVLATFAHAYSNDWFVIPLQLPAGGHVVSAVTVRDTFGNVTVVRPVLEQERGLGRWRMFDLTGSPTEAFEEGTTNPLVGLRILPPAAAPPRSGPDLEELLVTRDEMANLCWVIELVTRDADGHKVDRYQRWQHLRPAGPAATRSSGQAPSRYLLGTEVPDFWYPLEATTDDDGKPVLAYRELPEGARPVSDEGVIGTLVPHEAGTLIADEEAPREGTRLVLYDRLMVGQSGLVLWRARRRGPGRGGGSSGLRFDSIR